MPTTFSKLNLKQQDPILVLNAPASFESELQSLGAIGVLRTLPGAQGISFALAFLTQQEEVRCLAEPLIGALEDDAVLWFAYPKRSSRIASDLSRDRGWQALERHGYETVRAVALDEDWTALRFRSVVHIPHLRRAASRRRSSAG